MIFFYEFSFDSSAIPLFQRNHFLGVVKEKVCNANIFSTLKNSSQAFDSLYGFKLAVAVAVINGTCRCLSRRMPDPAKDPAVNMGDATIP